MENLTAQIDILDFSIDNDNQYLIYKDSNEEVVISNLKNQSKVNVIYVEQDLVWYLSIFKNHFLML